MYDRKFGLDAVEGGVPSFAHFLIVRLFYFRQRRRCNDHQWDSYQRPCLCEHVLQSAGQLILLIFRQRTVGADGVGVERRKLFRFAARDECRSLESGGLDQHVSCTGSNDSRFGRTVTRVQEPVGRDLGMAATTEGSSSSSTGITTASTRAAGSREWD